MSVISSFERRFVSTPQRFPAPIMVFGCNSLDIKAAAMQQGLGAFNPQVLKVR
jgi:hypothetical protein